MNALSFSQPKPASNTQVGTAMSDSSSGTGVYVKKGNRGTKPNAAPASKVETVIANSPMAVPPIDSLSTLLNQMSVMFTSVSSYMFGTIPEEAPIVVAPQALNGPQGDVSPVQEVAENPFLKAV